MLSERALLNTTLLINHYSTLFQLKCLCEINHVNKSVCSLMLYLNTTIANSKFLLRKKKAHCNNSWWFLNREETTTHITFSRSIL